MVERTFSPEAHAQAMRALLKEVAGRADPAGLELLRLVRMVANQYDSAAAGRFDPDGVTGPRWRLLLRLLAEERMCNGAGLTPSYLSRCQNVSKNTISALLRGLEEKGLIERKLDRDDRRFFRIRLTDAAREMILHSAPLMLERLNDLASALTAEEKAELIRLLGKLHRSLASESRQPAPAVAVAE